MVVGREGGTVALVYPGTKTGSRFQLLNISADAEKTLNFYLSKNNFSSRGSAA